MIVPVVMIAIAGAQTMPLDTLVAEIAEEQRAAGEDVQGGASEAAVEETKSRLVKEFGTHLPDDYALFLRRMNGVDFNGLVLYGAGQTPDQPGPSGFWQGLVAANAEWRRTGGHGDYLILGDSDMDLLTCSPNGKSAALRDRVSGDVVAEFSTVTEMLESVLSARLA